MKGPNSNGKKIKISSEEIKKIFDYMSEINFLKLATRTGWRRAGPLETDLPDYVASHATVTAHLAYIIARMEGLEQTDAFKCIALAMVHDDDETRLPEEDKVASFYLAKTPEIFLKAIKDQISQLPSAIGKEVLAIAFEANFGESVHAIIVKDADVLEASLQAKIFNERGFIIADDILKKYLDERRVQTKSAKKLMLALKQREKMSVRWWKDYLKL